LEWELILVHHEPTTIDLTSLDVSGSLGMDAAKLMSDHRNFKFNSCSRFLH
jgi:hypothetical protein